MTMTDKAQTVLLQDGAVGDRVEPWLRSRKDVDLLAVTSEKTGENLMVVLLCRVSKS